MEEKKKGNSGLIILVALLLLLCVGMGAFIFVNKDKLTAKENTKTTVENEKKAINEGDCKELNVYDTADSTITDLISNLNVSILGDWKHFELFVNDKKVEAKDVDQLTAYHMVERNYFSSDAKSISLEEFTKEVQKILGKDYAFKPESINYNGSSCPQYNYDANTKTFNKQQTACGGTSGPVGIKYIITKAVESDGLLEINVRVAFGDGSSIFYSDYARTKVLKEYSGSETDLDYSKAALYKFTFKSEDGNFVFVSSEPVK